MISQNNINLFIYKMSVRIYFVSGSAHGAVDFILQQYINKYMMKYGVII